MKPLWLLCLLLALSLVACQPVRPVGTAAQQGATPPQTDEEKIANALSAGPSSITQDAAVKDWPAVAGGEAKELRAGTNGWVCRPSDPVTPGNDPRCFSPLYAKMLGTAFGPDREANQALGVAYMLQGGNAANNDDPSVITPPAGQEWQIDPPHLMVDSPIPWDQSYYSSDHHSGGPWLMFKGTPAEHMMVPIGPIAIVAKSDDKIANAMSAGPASIAEHAAIMDWPATAGGDLVELRAGDNGWTCLPDDPTTPVGNDPQCLDQEWLKWLKAYMAGAEPEITHVGIAYMLQGGPVADNDDPMAMEPPAGKEWQIDPPHIMILSPYGWDPALYPTDIQSGGPWTMFGGTPYEHLMFPVTNRSSGN